MTITYDQKTGQITLRNTPVGIGYSGHGVGLDNPDLETMANVGPIPRGEWRIMRWDDVHGDKGPIVAVLAPMHHDAHGRSAFLIHGPHANDKQDSSHGCIVAAKPIREALRASGETKLVVT